MNWFKEHSDPVVAIVISIALISLVILAINTSPVMNTSPVKTNELARFVVECSDSVCSVTATNNEGGRVKLIGNLSPMDAQDMASHLYNTLRKQ